MPQYEFESETTGETVIIIQGMNEEHSYAGPGGPWKRVFSVPQAAITTDPFNQRHFMEKTANGGNYGDLLDLSREMSEARAAKCDGIDPVRVKKIADSKANRSGKLTNVEIAEKRKKSQDTTHEI